jgi:hypothetical protein
MDHNEMNKELLNKILKILEGINKEQTESENGWWETSIGAEFGKKKLEEITSLFVKSTKTIRVGNDFIEMESDVVKGLEKSCFTGNK